MRRLVLIGLLLAVVLGLGAGCTGDETATHKVTNRNRLAPPEGVKK
jgi:hypothetical protein